MIAILILFIAILILFGIAFVGMMKVEIEEKKVMAEYIENLVKECEKHDEQREI